MTEQEFEVYGIWVEDGVSHTDYIGYITLFKNQDMPDEFEIDGYVYIKTPS